jgi:NADH-quinone oxidoreductase subunit G
MEHVGTICTHCSNGCKTTLGVRNNEIIRANNRDHSGLNGEFLCIKGRYAFDFYHHEERLQTPLMKVGGKLEPVSWSQALSAVAAKFGEFKARRGRFGVIGSTRTTNEENFYLRKFARQGLETANIDHHRSGDVLTLLDAVSGNPGAMASTSDLYNKKAVLVVAADLAEEQPFLSFQIRANFRHHQAHVYAVTAKPVREDRYAAASLRVERGGELAAVESLRQKLAAEPELVILFGDAIQGDGVRKLVEFGSSLGIPVQYVCLLDYSNSRGAVDMGLSPDAGGMTIEQMLAAPDLDALWVVGANPLEQASLVSKSAFVVVHEMFLTETARAADVVFPASSAYEKEGTVTNVCGEVQRLRTGLRAMGTKPDLEILGLIAKEMGLAPLMGPWLHDAVFEEIRKTVRGYNLPAPLLAMGAAQTAAVNGRIMLPNRTDLIRSSHDTLFTSGTLGRYSKVLHNVMEGRGLS